MALINRISQLFKADLHAVLDQIEEPESTLRQAIREMADDLSETDQRVRALHDKKEMLQLRLEELAHSINEIDDELDVCFESGQEDLARSLIKRQLETRRLSKLVTTKLHTTEKEYLTQQKTLEENRMTLQSMRQKAELFATRAPNNKHPRSVIDEFSLSPRELQVSDHDVEVALLREKKRRANS